MCFFKLKMIFNILIPFMVMLFFNIAMGDRRLVTQEAEL